MSGGFTLERKQSGAIITFQNNILGTLERSRTYGCTRSTLVQLEDSPKKRKYPTNKVFFQSRIMGKF
jgi:hypothetical protein